MPSIDQRIDIASTWLLQKCFLLSCLAWNWISSYYSAAVSLLRKTLKGATDAHKASVWVFTSRNATPWRLLEGDANLVNMNSFPLTYYPESQEIFFFEEPSCPESPEIPESTESPESPESTEVPEAPLVKEKAKDEEHTKRFSKSFSDVVLAEMVNTVNTITIDLSSTFHNIRWHGNNVVNPSLYEVVIIHCLANNLIFTDEQLSSFTLRILTAESNDVTIELCSSQSRAPFTTWP